jgi:hypothetical protein
MLWVQVLIQIVGIRLILSEFCACYITTKLFVGRFARISELNQRKNAALSSNWLYCHVIEVKRTSQLFQLFVFCYDGSCCGNE